MKSIRSENTRPEMAIRKGLYALGFRYRLHDKKITGKPDLVLKKYNAVIFINGCYWHGHDCHMFKPSKTRPEYWKNRIEKNRNRDQKTIKRLRDEGWRVLLVWECTLKGKCRLTQDDLLNKISKWILSDRSFAVIDTQSRAE